ncbi:MAG: class I SAM-dependent methyltransferase [Campylobacter sp.]|nr:class I SAM-dependent methyltransferase [Campylobacter sp.]
MQNIWDKKANSYQRFDGKIGKFQQTVLDTLQNFGVNFKDKSIVDIGCGTGVWTLFLAQIASRITAIDGSKGMIEILHQDAAKFGIKNVFTIQKSWSEFNGDEIYDIALTTMSPAISNENDFEKFNALGKVKIYLGWARSRSSDLLEPFFKQLGRKSVDIMAVDRLEEWLKERNLAYKSEILTETRITKRSFKQAFENICWHLEINGLKFDEKEVTSMLEPICKDGFVDETIDSQMKLFVF